MASSIEDALAAAIPASALQPPNGKKESASKIPANDSDKNSTDDAMSQYNKDQDKVETARKERDEAESQAPKYPTLASEPKPDTSNDPIKGYTAVIGVLGAIGSMFTRRPMTNTMNAAAASIQAMNQKDAADFDKKFEAWKSENENAFKLLDYQNKIYDTVLKNKNLSVDQRIAEMQAHAAMFKDDYMMQLAKDRNLIDMGELQIKRQDAAGKASEYAEKIEEAKEKRDLIAQWNKENPNAPAEKKAEAYTSIMMGKIPSKGQQVTFSAQAIDQNVEALYVGGTPSSLGLSRNSPNYVAVENRMAELHPDFNMAEAEMNFAAGKKALGTVEQRAANINLAANSLDQAVPLVREALKKMDLEPSTDLNTVMNFLKEHSSDPNFSAYNLALNTALSDYASLAMRGAAVTVESRETAKQVIMNNMGDQAIGAVLDQMDKEKIAQKKAADQTIKETKKTALGGYKSDEPSQEDLEHTAKIHNMTVDQVKEQLGIK